MSSSPTLATAVEKVSAINDYTWRPSPRSVSFVCFKGPKANIFLMFKFRKDYNWMLCYFLYFSIYMKYFIMKIVEKEYERRERP